jgi:hypothetical protein
LCAGKYLPVTEVNVCGEIAGTGDVGKIAGQVI